jgi:beta-glucosidase
MKIRTKNESSSWQDFHRKTVAEMSLEEKIAQMAQIDINMMIRDDGSGGKELDPDAVEEWIGRKGVGSVLNVVSGGFWTAKQYRQAVIDIQKVAKQYHRPPVIWGIDTVHGANYIRGAVVTPQAINLAATFNRTAAYHAGKLGSRDTRAGGMSWLFSPLLGLSLESRWGRVYETFGEDPHLVGEMASAMIHGIQEPTGVGIPSRAAACGKHFVGYSQSHNGHDRSPSAIPRRHLYQYYVPPWITAISKAKVMTIMESYVEYDGVPNVANHEALVYLLRNRLGFKGMLVTDYREIKNLEEWHHVAKDYKDAVQKTLSQGSVDMNMVPADYDEFQKGIQEGIVSHILTEDRITVSADRIIKLKQDLGMYDEEVTMDDDNLPLVGTDVDDVYETVVQSIVLAKNNNATLPLNITKGGKTDKIKVLVTGPTSSSRIYPTGGWTGEWQGVPIEDEDKWFSYGNSLLGAFESESSMDVTFRCGVGILGDTCEDKNNSTNLWDEAESEMKNWMGIKDGTGSESIQRAADAASVSDIVVVALGEEPYAEKPADIRSLDLPAGQYSLVKHIRDSAPQAKILLVYYGGRPRLLRPVVDLVDAVLIGFLPGPSAARALVDIVTGRVNPSGRLPITYPLYDDGGGVPYFRAVSDQCTVGEGLLPHWQYGPCEVQWPFGHGLSFTDFEYSQFRATGGIDRDLNLSVTVKNSGEKAGAETVMFFTFDDFRPTTPEYKRLRAFEKIYLHPGEETTVELTVSLDSQRFVGSSDDSHYVIDPSMTSWVGVGHDTDCRYAREKDSELCIHLAAKNPRASYSGACEAACNVWRESNCSVFFGMAADRCVDMCLDGGRYLSTADGSQNQGWGWNYVKCIESVVYGFQESGSKDQCWQMTSLCRDIFHTSSLSESESSWRHDRSSFQQQGVPEANYVALVIGLVASAVVFVLMRGGWGSFKRRLLEPGNSELEFMAVNTQEGPA